VLCNEQRELCNAYSAGSGGWPTLYSFSAATPKGALFPRTMPGAVCDELASPGRLSNYVAGTVAQAKAAFEATATARDGEL
jgi:hypothetical protein